MGEQSGQNSFDAADIAELYLSQGEPRYVHKSVLRKHGIHPPNVHDTCHEFKDVDAEVLDGFIQFLYTGRYDAPLRRYSDTNFESTNYYEDDRPNVSIYPAMDQDISPVAQRFVQARDFMMVIRQTLQDAFENSDYCCDGDELLESNASLQDEQDEQDEDFTKFAPNLLFHAHLYDLGHQYDATTLKDLALSNLHRALCNVNVNHVNDSDLFEFIRYVYDEPAEDEPFRTMRHLLANYLSSELMWLWNEEDFFDLLGTVPELARDILVPFALM